MHEVNINDFVSIKNFNLRTSELMDNLLDFIKKYGFDPIKYTQFKSGMVLFRERVEKYQELNRQKQLYDYISKNFDTIIRTQLRK